MANFSRSGLKISQKLIISFLIIGTLSIVTVSFVFFQTFKKALIQRTLDQLSSVNVLKKQMIEDYLNKNDGAINKELIKVKQGQEEFTYFRPDGKIQKIVFIRAGMGNTGESYIVEDNFRLLTKSRFFPDSLPFKIIANTSSVNKALNGTRSAEITEDYRHVTVLSAFRSLTVDGRKMVIVSEIDMEEAMRSLEKIRDYLVVICLLVSLCIVIVTFILANKISNPILKLKTVIDSLSKGILPKEKVDVGTKDEISEMALAIEKLINGLKRTSDFAQEIGHNNLEKEFKPLSDQDVLGHSLLQMRDRLKEIQKKEILFVRERSSALLEGQENERKRLARELHDGLGQMLSAIKIKLNLVETSENISEIKKYLDETITEARRISNNLMPSVLLDFGLEAGLRLLCQNAEKFSEIPVEFTYAEIEGNEKLDFETVIGLYRFSQEALNNAIKHSQASHIKLSVLKYPDYVSLEVSDNGKGFDIKAMQRKDSESKGLKNMTERAKLLNGTIEIESQQGKGTTITIETPVKHE